MREKNKKPQETIELNDDQLEDVMSALRSGKRFVRGAQTVAGTFCTTIVAEHGIVLFAVWKREASRLHRSDKAPAGTAE